MEKSKKKKHSVEGKIYAGEGEGGEGKEGQGNEREGNEEKAVFNYKGLKVQSTGKFLGTYDVADLRLYDAKVDGKGVKGEGKPNESGEEGEPGGEGESGDQLGGDNTMVHRRLADLLDRIAAETPQTHDPEYVRDDPNIVSLEDMTPEDKEKAAKVVRRSLEKSLDSEAVKKWREENEDEFNAFTESLGITSFIDDFDKRRKV